MGRSVAVGAVVVLLLVALAALARACRGTTSAQKDGFGSYYPSQFWPWDAYSAAPLSVAAPLARYRWQYGPWHAPGWGPYAASSGGPGHLDW